MADLDVIHASNRFLATNNKGSVPRAILSTIELEQTPIHRHVLFFLHSYERSVFRHDDLWILRLLNRFLSFWSQITFTQHLK